MRDQRLEPAITATTESALLRHFLAALAYRTQTALKDAPLAFADFRAVENLRTPRELIWHMTGVIGYAVSLLRGTTFRPARLETFDDEVRRFHATLEELAALLDSRALSGSSSVEGATAERLLQGPLADALTHAGQLAMLRRIQGRLSRELHARRHSVVELGSGSSAAARAQARLAAGSAPPAQGRPLR